MAELANDSNRYTHEWERQRRELGGFGSPDWLPRSS